jgi:hypothetical protein
LDRTGDYNLNHHYFQITEDQPSCITPIINGEKETGVSKMRDAKDEDSRDITFAKKNHYNEDEKHGHLWEKFKNNDQKS